MSITFAANLTKMINAGLGGEMLAPETSVAVGYQVDFKEVSGPLASWNDPVGGLPLKSLIAAFEPIQSGTGDPSPENVRPISGRDSVTITRTALNMFGGTLLRDGVKAALPNATDNTEDGYISFASTTPFVKNITDDCGLSGKFKENTQYTFILTLRKSSGNGSNLRIYYTDYSYTTISLSQSREKEVVVVVTARGKNVYALSKTNGAGTTYLYYNESGIFEGVHTAADFVPYNGQQIAVQFDDTVYGGSLDVTTGVMTVEWENIASYDGETLPGEWISDRDVYAEGTTPTTGAQVCYKLAEPLTVQLSPTEITSLLGQNNLWSDAGDVSVTWKEKTYTEGY